jgi:hypothetical protein
LATWSKPGRSLARELGHRPGVTLRAGHRLGDPEIGRSAFVGRVADITALALDQSIDQLIDVDDFFHPLLLFRVAAV